MTKNELAKELAARMNKDNFSLTDAMNTVNKVIEIMAETLENGEEIVIREFACFKPVVRKARVSRSDFRAGSGKSILVPEHKDIKLKVYKQLKERINKNK